ncbi:response regulator [Roseibium sp.]|uniref:response regulator n=1 Tax=Roseibium sp. TaxID=1936156 RepID=UPI003A97911A
MPELKKILYADDEPDIRDIVALTLSSLGGFDVKACENGADAIAAAGTFKPDLILLDVMMPGLTGPESLSVLRGEEATAMTPAIFITAKARPEEVEELIQHTRTGIITKPFDPMRLPDEVKSIWARLSSE